MVSLSNHETLPFDRLRVSGSENGFRMSGGKSGKLGNKPYI
jgi:hypothetical protein